MAAKSVVKQHWREFEKLALEMIESKLTIRPDVIHLTQASKDGGYDAEILHELAQVENVRLAHKTLLEAKLRSDEGSLGLRSFAATIVIAFNVAAQTLVVVSNRLFSKQALEQAACFCWKTNMQILLVDGPTLAGWIVRERERLGNHYPPALLDYLSRQAEELVDGELRTFEITHGPVGRAHRGGASAEPVHASIELGWRSADEIASCRIELGATSNGDGETREPLKLIGAPREALARNLTLALASRPGVAVLYGRAGVGKSVVAEAVRRGLREHETATSVVDLTTLHGVRQLFVHVLGELSGIDIVAAVESDAREASLRNLFSRVAGVPIRPEVQSALVAVFQGSYEQHQARRDLDANLLLTFLREAVAPYAARRRAVLFFENLNRATPEVLEFLHALVATLPTAGVGVLVELRDAQETAIVAPREWEAFVRLFRLAADLGEFTVSPLTAEEAEAYLTEFLPGMGPERLGVVRRRVGHLPLFLRSAALWLHAHEVVRGTEAFLLVEDLEAFFEGIRPDEAIIVIDRLIETQWERADVPFADCISAAVLFDGLIDDRVLERLFPDRDPAALLERLSASGLFTRSGNRSRALVPAHDLMLERMQATARDRPFRSVTIAEKLLPALPDLESDPLTREMRAACLLRAAAAWEAAHASAMQAAEALRDAREWAESARFYAMAEEAAEHLPAELGSVLARIHALVGILEVEYERARTGLERNLRRLDALKTLLRTTPEVERLPGGAELKLRVMLLDWRAAFYRERFDEALRVARDSSRHARRGARDADPELRGQVFSGYGITLKATDRRAASARFFDRALRVLPGSLMLQTEVVSNRAALALQHEPKVALAHHREVLRLIDGKPYPLSLQLHCVVDVAMALFLDRRYTEALAHAREALHIASANAVPAQEARARNIIGCCLWATMDAEAADREFDLACLASERMFSHRFLWRMRCNRAGTAAELGNRDAALVSARSAEDLILSPREESLHRVEPTRGYWTLRWYVALLAVSIWYDRAGSCEDVERLVSRVRLSAFAAHARAVRAGDFPDEVFGGTTHLHAGRIMVTG
ncbi:MAG TPA: AAA family ATPase [Longimicrobium sp.]|jgi:tetratricopeptide (TPR) repeat protein